MLKPYSELSQIDVTPFCKKRDGNMYLPWAMCKKLLHDNGAETVYFEPLYSESGSSLFMSPISFADKNGVENRCYEVRVKIVVDDKEWVTNYPLLNGNNPVKDNYLKQLRLNNAQARAFVKGVAVHTGLGFSLWLEDEDVVDDPSRHSMLAIKKRVEEMVTAKVQHMDMRDILSGLNINEKQFKTLMGMYDQLHKFEQALMRA